MFPEKPKRTPRKQRAPIRWLLIALLGLPIPVTLLFSRRVQNAQLVDMLLIGIMLCCTVYLLYQGALWMMSVGLEAEDDDRDSVQS